MIYHRPFELANLNTDNSSAILFHEAGTISPKYQLQI